DSSPGDRMAAAGYVFSGSWSWGENIAMRYGFGIAMNSDEALIQHNQLFLSPGHRQNLLYGTFREIGAGHSVGAWEGMPGVTTTQKFAKSGNDLFLVGVAFTDLDGDDFYDPGEGLGGISVQIALQSSNTTYATTTM